MTDKPRSSDARRRVLFVTTELASPPRTGGEIRTHRLIEALSARADVHVAVLSPSDTEAVRTATGAVAVSCHPRRSSRVVVRARAAAHRWPVSASRWWQPALHRLIEDNAAAGTRVVLDHSFLDVLRPGRTPYVLSLHNVESSLRANLPHHDGLLRRAQTAWDLRALARLESAAAQRERTTVVTVSAADAEALGGSACVVENGTDLPAEPGPRPSQGGLLYVGNMAYAPNRAAVEWWVREVAPRLRDGLPTLTVVGRGGRAAFGDTPGLDVLDEVADLAPLLRDARVIVVPLQHGGGTRLKVLEGLAWQRPVVSTTKGAEGLRVVHGEHLLLADGPADFATAVERLWDDDALVAGLTARGRELARTYDWQRIGAAFADVVLGGAP